MEHAKTVLILGALDTKGEDLAFVRQAIRDQGLNALVMDTGVIGEPAFTPDVTRRELMDAAACDAERIRSGDHKDEAMAAMARGASVVTRQLRDRGQIDGIIGMGGTGGTAVATAAMRALPVGFPKVMLSTVAGGDVRTYVGTTDITMMPSIVDVAGLNRISRRMYANAAGAIAGMVQARDPSPAAAGGPVVAASMFGNTTACVDQARAALEAQGCEVLVFHATGVGGRTMEGLITDGFVDCCLDLTTTEVADEVCGGVFSAGGDRGSAAPTAGLPTVIAPGCVDMANFGAPDTVPVKYAGRTLYRWNDNVTLLRTNIDENRIIGEKLAAAANQAVGPVSVLLPLRGLSMLDSLGHEFWDPEADEACFGALRANLRTGIPVHELDANINDPEFADAAANELLRLMKEQ